MKTIVLGGGCFWCIEAIFQRLKGVEKVVSGYAGGEQANPTYRNHGNHAEVVQITYDESVINLETLFEVFFHMHDPTTLNQPGTADVGENYRSIILVSDDEELKLANTMKDTAQLDWTNPIITEVKKLDTFYPAEDYHQDFYNQNPNQPYCQVVIDPKLAKFRKHYASLLKEDA